MLRKENVHNVLSNFTANVIAEARSNLKKSNSNASNRLSDSLEDNISVGANSIDVDIFMEDYGEFIDKGVSGTEVKYNTPYSYKRGIKNRPSPRHFDNWIIRKGIAPRNEQGQFISRSSMKFAIATSIQRKGIKPTLFLTKAFEKEFKNLPEEVVEAYGLDIENFIEFVLNN